MKDERAQQNPAPNTKGSVDGGVKLAVLLCLVENSLGSLLHALYIPFAGHFLSLNQGFFLSQSAWKKKNAKEALHASSLCALLKSLSPAGKKLTPMLAISMQGNLFFLGVHLFGANYLGISIGMIFLSLWGFVQALLIYFLLYGKALVEVGQYFLQRIQEVIPIQGRDLLWVALGLVLFKLILAILLVFLAKRLKAKEVSHYQESLRSFASRYASPKPRGLAREQGMLEKIKRSLKDLFHPLFILSYLLTIFFFLFSHSNHSVSIWILIRPLALGFLLFFGFRWFSPILLRLPFLQSSRILQGLEQCQELLSEKEEKQDQRNSVFPE